MEQGGVFNFFEQKCSIGQREAENSLKIWENNVLTEVLV